MQIRVSTPGRRPVWKRPVPCLPFQRVLSSEAEKCKGPTDRGGGSTHADSLSGPNSVVRASALGFQLRDSQQAALARGRILEASKGCAPLILIPSPVPVLPPD